MNPINKRQKRSNAVSREEVARMRLMRMASGEIARELDVTLETISRVLAEPEVQAIIAEAEADAMEDAKKALRTATRRAARRMIELMGSNDERIALDAAKTLLTKAGADAPSKGEITGKDGGPLVVREATVEEIERAREALRMLDEDRKKLGIE